MKETTSRRNFVGRLSLAATSFMAIAFGSTAAALAKNEGSPEPVAGPKSPIKKVKPMGFQWETQDPFLFCVHHEDFYPHGNDEMGPSSSLAGRDLGQDFLIKDGFRMYHGLKVPGFPRHPHRGFETVTVVRTGLVDHTDSMGSTGRYGGGDVQWMTAGAGIQHAEMFPLTQKDKDNPLELFQIWLNLPKVNKFAAPSYKMLWGEDIPVHEFCDDDLKNIDFKIIAGQYRQLTAPSPPPDSWASDPKNDVAIWTIRMDAGAKFHIPAANADSNRTLYFFKGSSMKIAGTTMKAYHMAEVEAGETIEIEAGPDRCGILMLQGKPINEPVVQHGPFVMNTREEVQQAYADYQETQFGGWPYQSNSPVNERHKARFAKHSDGREVFPTG